MGARLPKFSRKSHATKYQDQSHGETGDMLSAEQASAIKQYPRQHQGEVKSVAAIDGTSICVSGGTDKIVHAFDAVAGKAVERWSGHSAQIVKVCTGGEGDLVFSSSRDKTIKCWSFNDPSASFHSLTGHTLVAPALSFSKETQKLFSGSRDNSVRLWDVQTAACISTKDMPRNIVTDVDWFADGNMVAQTGEDKAVKIWDTRIMEVAISFPLKQYFQTCCSVSDDDMSIVTGSTGFNGKGSEVVIWDVRQRAASSELHGHQGRVTGCRFLKTTHQESSNGDILVGSVSCDSSLKVWDVGKSECISSVSVDGAAEITAMSELIDNRVALSTIERGICIYDLHHPSMPCLVASY